jgi:hypothetical protein
MKYLKLFESFNSKFRSYETEISGFKIEVEDAGPNNYDGGVQVDSVVITCNNNKYSFELHTPVGGDGETHVKYLGSDDGDKEFITNFELIDNKYLNNEDNLKQLQLIEFLQVNSPDCIGDEVEIEGYDIEITDFNHDGGMEFGFIETTINGEKINFEMIQDATSGFDYNIDFGSNRDEEKAKKIGFEITDEVREFLFDCYDSICAEKR